MLGELLKDISYISCYLKSILGKPEPSIKWYKKDKEITDGADFEISYKDGRVSLTIPEVLEEQSGQVTCTASNYVGCASSTAELIVRGKYYKFILTKFLLLYTNFYLSLNFKIMKIMKKGMALQKRHPLY